jgi:hypothetical protein
MPWVAKEISQNWQARALEGSTAPQCKQVLVTVSFALRTLTLGEECTAKEYHGRNMRKLRGLVCVAKR